MNIEHTNQSTAPEPFGYFKAEPFGWTDCEKDDDGAVALYDRPQAQPVARDVLMAFGKGDTLHLAVIDTAQLPIPQLTSAYVRSLAAGLHDGMGGHADACAELMESLAKCMDDAAAQLDDIDVADLASQQAEPVAWKPGHRPPSVFKTSEAGRQFVADFFANALRRHDFSSYIKGHLAADFACALSDGLHAMQTVQQQAEPRCACGDSFTSDAVCANCVAAQPPVQQQAEHIVEATEMVQQDEPVAAQCRSEGEEEWNPCTIAHHLLVQAHPKEWPHYETRALYAQPPAVAVPEVWRDAMERAAEDLEDNNCLESAHQLRAMLAAAPQATADDSSGVRDAAAVPDQQDEPGPIIRQFGYQPLFNAISSATQWRDGRTIEISVLAFQKALLEATPKDHRQAFEEYHLGKPFTAAQKGGA